MYELCVEASCEHEIRSNCKKNKPLKEAMEKKLARILDNPYMFKPLRAPMDGARRVHILGSFVLVYDIKEKEGIVRLLRFAHHDEAYR